MAGAALLGSLLSSGSLLEDLGVVVGAAVLSVAGLVTAGSVAESVGGLAVTASPAHRASSS